MQNKKPLLFVLSATALVLAGCGNNPTPTVSSVQSAESSSAAEESSSSVVVSSEVVTSEETSEVVTSEETSEETSEVVTSEETSEESSEEDTGFEVFYTDKTFGFGGEGDSVSNRGKMMYWAGEGGVVSSAVYEAGDFVLNYSNASSGQWYAIQMFYTLPYAVANDVYDVVWNVNSDAAGVLRVNNTVYDLVAGDNLLAFEMTQGAGATLSVQLGEPSGAKLGGSKLVFSAPSITDMVNTYHSVTFTVENEIVKNIMVRDGFTVTAPEAPAPAEGFVFSGWYDDDGNRFDGTITGDVLYFPVYIPESEATKYTVNIIENGVTLLSTEVLEGNAFEMPVDFVPSYGHTLVGLYVDEDLSTLYTGEAIVADTDLYAKTQISPKATFMNTGDTGWVIPDGNMSHSDDGSLTVSFAGWGADKWVVQVNFGVPSGEAGTTYVINVTYDMNVAGGDVMIYDGNS
ncbi:MAG: InlB B-repeat-containing protein, partial [Bacilli bacterium]|nr:InlB B-repeat-containing protein [Bacilli bacterium]